MFLDVLINVRVALLLWEDGNKNENFKTYLLEENCIV
jgi:hypothetical protein